MPPLLSPEKVTFSAVYSDMYNATDNATDPGNHDSYFIADLVGCFYGSFYWRHLFIQKVSFWKYKPKNEKAIGEKKIE